MQSFYIKQSSTKPNNIPNEHLHTFIHKPKLVKFRVAGKVWGDDNDLTAGYIGT